MANSFSDNPDFVIKSKEFYKRLDELKETYPNKKIDFLEFGIVPPDFNAFVFEDRIALVEIK